MGNSFTGVVAAGAAVRNLAYVRAEFVRATGRYDLVVAGDPDGDDAGANKFINAGQAYLDLRGNAHKQTRRMMFAIGSGDYKVSMTDLMSVSRVSIIDADGRSDIMHNWSTPAEFYANAPKLISAWDTGQPVNWTQDYIGLAPEHITANDTSTTFDSAGIVGYGGVTFGREYASKGILLYPKADGDYTVEVVGKFFSLRLASSGDISYWTWWYPDLLVLAAAYAHERTMRNMAGQRQWLEAINNMLLEIDRASVAEDLGGMRLQMKG